MIKKSFIIEESPEGGFHFQVVAFGGLHKSFRSPNHDAIDFYNFMKELEPNAKLRITKVK